MSGDTPSQDQARQTLAEAAGRAGSVRSADRPFAGVLLILAVTYLVVGAIVGLLGPSAGGGLALLVVFALGLVAVVTVLLRMRASSRVGSWLYAAGIISVSLWNAAVIAGSVRLGWWAPGTPGWHFTLSAAIAALPLLVVGGVLWARTW